MPQHNLRSYIRDVPDFPKPGILFRDIGPLLADAGAFSRAIDAMAEISGLKSEPARFDAIVGIESRGFLLGAAMAARFGKGFVPLRKAGKLPPPVEAEAYALEYGQATLEIGPAPRAGLRALIIDDVLATGGTLAAALALCARAGFATEAVAVLINLKSLNGLRFRGREIPSAIEF